MSSGRTEANRKGITFEINHNNVVGRFYLAHIDGDGLNGDRILMKMTADAAHYPDNLSSSTSVVITKEYTKVLSHWFRHAADIMDEWYKKETE